MKGPELDKAEVGAEGVVVVVVADVAPPGGGGSVGGAGGGWERKGAPANPSPTESLNQETSSAGEISRYIIVMGTQQRAR